MDIYEKRNELRKKRDISKINNTDEYNQIKADLKEVSKEIKNYRDRKYIYERIHCEICNEDILKYNKKTHDKTKKHIRNLTENKN